MDEREANEETPPLDFVVLMGPPGAGKTRLAERARAELGLSFTSLEPEPIRPFGRGAEFARHKSEALAILEAALLAQHRQGPRPVLIESTGLSDRPILERLATDHRVALLRLGASASTCLWRVSERARGVHHDDDLDRARIQIDHWFRTVAPGYRYDRTIWNDGPGEDPVAVLARFLEERRLPVPTRAAALTASWCEPVVRLRHPRARVTAVETERIGVGFGLASAIDRVHLAGRGGPATLVVKRWDFDATTRDREIFFYRHLAEQTPIRLPRCDLARRDAGARRGVLVLEDLAGAVQGDCLTSLDVEGARRLVSLLARWHARWWEDETIVSTAEEDLPRAARTERDAAWIEDRRAGFEERFGGRIAADCRNLSRNVASLLARSDGVLARWPATLLHGDLHLDNVLFLPGGEPVVLDWARVRRGPCVLDLAAVLFDPAPLGAIAELTEHYRVRLAAEGGPTLAAGDLAEGLTAALERRFVDCTLGIVRWLPSTAREERLIDRVLETVQDAVRAWRALHPGRLTDP